VIDSSLFRSPILHDTIVVFLVVLMALLLRVEQQQHDDDDDDDDDDTTTMTTTTMTMMRWLLPHLHGGKTNHPPPQQHLVVLDTVLRGLYGRYLERVPPISTILHHLVQQQQQQPAPLMMMIENDHIAFRSLLLSPPHHHSPDEYGGGTTTTTTTTGIARLERYFVEECGYTKRDFYQFDEKKLNAYWYAPPSPPVPPPMDDDDDIGGLHQYYYYPRIFISELRVTELSVEAQAILNEAIVPPTTSPITTTTTKTTIRDDHHYDENNDDVHHDKKNEDSNNHRNSVARGQTILAEFQTPLFTNISYEKYQFLRAESEYAAWVYGMNVQAEMNHLTLAVHSLPPPLNELRYFNEMITNELGLSLNAPNNPIQTSPDGLLLQSSTVAQLVAVDFTEDNDNGDDADVGTTTTTTRRQRQHSIPGSYVEFAERRVLPQFADVLSPGREHRREGFETANANVIFESTIDNNTTRRADDK
jgi:Domain of unknown function (DUF1338)